MPVVERMIARCGFRLPPRRLGCHTGGGRLPVVQILDGGRLAEPGNAGGVRHQLADQDVLLAGRGELRPVPGDRRVDVKLAPVGKHQRREAGHRLGRGPDVGDGALGPRGRPLLVAETAPQVDDDVPVDVQDQRRPQLFAGGQVPRQGQAHRLEPRLTRAMQIGHGRHPPLLRGPEPEGTRAAARGDGRPGFPDVAGRTRRLRTASPIRGIPRVTGGDLWKGCE